MPKYETGTAVSPDGTLLAWTRIGAGPALVMVAGVMASRSRPQQPGLAEALSADWTVWTYDRRGTGDSAAAGPYSLDRECEDLQTILSLAGAPATVYGFSSGATLALLATRSGVPASRLVVVEPVFVADTDVSAKAEAESRLDADVAGARRWFDHHVTGIPAEVLASFPPLTDEDLRNTPSMLHELTFLPGTAPGQFDGLTTPTLIMVSDRTATDLLDGARELARNVSNSQLKVVAGQWHGVPQDILVEQIRLFASQPTR